MSWDAPAPKFQPTAIKYPRQNASSAPPSVNWGLVVAIPFALALWCAFFALVLGW
jgi:hypothetical protein